MENIITFHKSMQGSTHIKKGLQCEDASLSLSDPQNRYHILAVADGHGDPTCVRSGFGAKTAVSTAVESLKELAENILCNQENEGDNNWEHLFAPYYRQSAIRRISNSILYRWSQAVMKDLKDNPLKPLEYEKAGKMREAYQKGESLEHIYGTTLICGLFLPPFLILIQQGDGRCDVFYSDGSVDQPIPWDERCYENQTTSLCDIDAVESVRSCVIDTREKEVFACLMGSDGVEDSFFDMEGTHTFYRELICEICGKSPEVFEHYLAERLPELSRTGSGDDISVAGFVDTNEAQKFMEKLSRQAEAYRLNDSLKLCEDRLQSMERKHDILKRKIQDTESKLVNMEKRLASQPDTTLLIEKYIKHPQIYHPNSYWKYIKDQIARVNELERRIMVLKQELKLQKDEYNTYHQKYLDIHEQRDLIRDTISKLETATPESKEIMHFHENNL